MELSAADKAEITELVFRYATSIDQRDWALFRTVWTDDVRADYGAIGSWEGVDALTDYMIDIHAPCGDTLHRISNVVVWTDDDGTVRARSYVDAVILASDTHAMRALGTYEDEVVATDAGWRIARRHFRTFHLRMAPINDAI